jgi:tRNA dimethylallyltransferase
VPDRKLFPLIAVVGPTGSGKTELALHLASRLDGEIVNCDSLQIFRHFNLGTAKPSTVQQLGIPHHLLDVADPAEVYTAGEYARQGRQALKEIAGRGRLPLVVGGTGFYLTALLDGLFTGPGRDPALRKRLDHRERRCPGSLHRLLQRFDPAAARKIHIRDRNKTMRALEVCLLTRKPITELFAGGRDALEGFRTLKIGLDPPREALYRKLDERTRRMFAAGLVEETREIVAMGYSPDLKPFESLGYRQALDVIAGRCAIEEAIASTQQETRRYAKRQWTWFRRDPQIQWLQGFGSDPELKVMAVDTVRMLLSEGC